MLLNRAWIKGIIILSAGLMAVITVCFLKNSSVYINEVVSCNHHIIYDSIGKAHDYIELYNPSSKSIDLSGWHLSDSKKKLDKFTFPFQTIIEPKQYYILWAAKETNNLSKKEDYLYTNFSIRNGENIYLSNSAGKVVDKIKVPKKLLCDQSYARLPFVNLKSIREPSPGKPNPLYKKKIDKMLVDIQVTLSQPSGFYNDPFQLKMSAPEGFDIYYTLDSTYPDKNAIKYSDPITITDASQNPNKYTMIDNISNEKAYLPKFLIDKATIVRAIAIRKRDGAKSEVANATYFIGFQNKMGYKNMPIISMIVDPEDLFDYEKGIYVKGKLGDVNKNINTADPIGNYAAHGVFWRRPAFVETFGKSPVNWNGHYEIGLHGNFSVQDAQKGFQIISHTPTEGKEYVLRAGSVDKHFTKVREWLIQNLSQGRNIKTLDVGFAILFLNGEYWGIYNLQEKGLSVHNISQAFGIAPSNLVIYKKYPPITLQTREYKILPKEMAGKIDLPNYFFNTDTKLTPDQNYQKLSVQIDMDSLIDYLVIEIYIGNPDWIGNNLVRYRTLNKGNGAKQDTRWRYILEDVDNSSGFSYIKPEVNSFWEGWWGIVGYSPAFNKLIKNSEFRKKFIITYQDIANYNFNPKRVNAFLDDILDKYLENMILTFRRFKKPNYNKEDYIREIDVIRNFFEKRFDYMMPYMKDYFKLTGDLVKIHKIPSQLQGGEVILNTLTLRADEDYVGRYYSDYTISLDVNTFPGYTFRGWLIDGKLVASPKQELPLTHSHKIEAVWDKVTGGE